MLVSVNVVLHSMTIGSIDLFVLDDLAKQLTKQMKTHCGGVVHCHQCCCHHHMSTVIVATSLMEANSYVVNILA